LKAATRLHEVGITSNRRTACYGESVLRSCTHRPSHARDESFMNSFFNYLFVLFFIKL